MPDGIRNGISADKTSETKTNFHCNEGEAEDGEGDEQDELGGGGGGDKLRKPPNLNLSDLLKTGAMMGEKNGNSGRLRLASGPRDSDYVILVLSQRQREDDEVNMLIDRLRENGVSCLFMKNGTNNAKSPLPDTPENNVINDSMKPLVESQPQPQRIRQTHLLSLPPPPPPAIEEDLKIVQNLPQNGTSVAYNRCNGVRTKGSGSPRRSKKSAESVDQSGSSTNHIQDFPISPEINTSTSSMTLRLPFQTTKNYLESSEDDEDLDEVEHNSLSLKGLVNGQAFHKKKRRRRRKYPYLVRKPLKVKKTRAAAVELIIPQIKITHSPDAAAIPVSVQSKDKKVQEEFSSKSLNGLFPSRSRSSSRTQSVSPSNISQRNEEDPYVFIPDECDFIPPPLKLFSPKTSRKNGICSPSPNNSGSGAEAVATEPEIKTKVKVKRKEKVKKSIVVEFTSVTNPLHAPPTTVASEIVSFPTVEVVDTCCADKISTEPSTDKAPALVSIPNDPVPTTVPLNENTEPLVTSDTGEPPVKRKVKRKRTNEVCQLLQWAIAPRPSTPRSTAALVSSAFFARDNNNKEQPLPTPTPPPPVVNNDSSTSSSNDTQENGCANLSKSIPTPISTSTLEEKSQKLAEPQLVAPAELPKSELDPSSVPNQLKSAQPQPENGKLIEKVEEPIAPEKSLVTNFPEIASIALTTTSNAIPELDFIDAIPSLPQSPPESLPSSKSTTRSSKSKRKRKKRSELHSKPKKPKVQITRKICVQSISQEESKVDDGDVGGREEEDDKDESDNDNSADDTVAKIIEMLGEENESENVLDFTKVLQEAEESAAGPQVKVDVHVDAEVISTDANLALDLDKSVQLSNNIEIKCDLDKTTASLPVDYNESVSECAGKVELEISKDILITSNHASILDFDKDAALTKGVERVQGEGPSKAERFARTAFIAGLSTNGDLSAISVKPGTNNNVETTEPFFAIPESVGKKVLETDPISSTSNGENGEEMPNSFLDAMQLRRPSFYSLIAGNVRNNMENFLDGRMDHSGLEGTQGKSKRRKRPRPRNGFLLHHGDNFPEDPEAPYKLHLATQIILKLNKRRSKFKPKEDKGKSLLSYLKLVPKRASRTSKNSMPPPPPPPANNEDMNGAGASDKEKVPESEEGPKVTSVFSGEWVQKRNFVCNLCGQVEKCFWDMVHHKGEIHPGIVVTHVELVDMPPEGFRCPPPMPSMASVPPPPPCTKCAATFGTYADLHRHIFECAGNTEWLKELKEEEPQPQRKKKSKRKRGFNTFKRRLSNTPKKLNPKVKTEQSPLKRPRTSEVFKCEFCTREFKTEGWLKNHLTNHSLPISIPLDKLKQSLPPRASGNVGRRSLVHNLLANGSFTTKT